MDLAQKENMISHIETPVRSQFQREGISYDEALKASNVIGLDYDDFHRHVAVIDLRKLGGGDPAVGLRKLLKASGVAVNKIAVLKQIQEDVAAKFVPAVRRQEKFERIMADGNG